MARNKILLIDDDAGVRFGVRDFLDQQGYEVEEADSCRQATEVFRASRPDAVILDYMLPDGTALELLPRLKSINAETPLIVLTGHGSIDLAVRAIKEGADHFLTKPVELPVLLLILERLLENQRNRRKQLVGKAKQSRRLIDPFVGTSRAIRQLAERAGKLLATESPVLIQRRQARAAEDIPTLARHLLQQFAGDLGRGELQLSPEAERSLQSYSWPGNIRELRNVLERAALLSDHSILTSKDLHLDGLTPTGYEVDCVQQVEEAEALLSKGCYSVIIADLRLAGIGDRGGIEVIRLAQKRCPGTKNIVLTACGSADLEAEVRGCGVGAFLQKARPLAEVAQVVCGLLGSTS